MYREKPFARARCRERRDLGDELRPRCVGQRNRADHVTVVDDNSPRGQQRLGGVLGCERWIGEQARRRELELVAP